MSFFIFIRRQHIEQLTLNIHFLVF